MNNALGFAAAIVSITVWGSYFVPMKKIKTYDPVFMQLVMTLSVIIFSTIFSLAVTSLQFVPLGIVAGLMWAIGNILSVLAIRDAGLSRATPIWMGIIILISFTSGPLLFQEQFISLPLATLGILSLIVGIIVISSARSETRQGTLHGIYYAATAGVLYALSGVLYKFTFVDSYNYIFSLALGAFIGGILIYILKQGHVQKKLIVPGVFAGVMWNIGAITALVAVDNLGIAVGFPLTQLALFVSILWGILYFKEMRDRKSIKKIVLGAIILFSGALLLSFSK